MYTQNQGSTSPGANIVQGKLFQRFGGCCWLPAQAVGGTPGGPVEAAKGPPPHCAQSSTEPCSVE